MSIRTRVTNTTETTSHVNVAAYVRVALTRPSLVIAVEQLFLIIIPWVDGNIWKQEWRVYIRHV